MNDLFTENNIETVLSFLKQDVPKKQVEKRNVRTYDFKKAMRFSQDQIRTLTRIHENFARILTSHFSTQLRTLVQISVSAVEQYTFEEFIQNIGKNPILGVFKAPPLEGRMIFEIPAEVANVMLDRLLGGQGTNVNQELDLTEIELNIMQRVFLRALQSFEEAWSSVVKLSPELKEIEVNPQFLSSVPPNETVILVSLSTSIGDVSGVLNICLPHLVLEQILPKLSARHWLANQKKDREEHEVVELQKRLKHTMLDVKAVLGKSTISIQEFLHLKTGDVIRLNETYDDPVTILVDDKKKFLAQPGISKGKIAVQVTDVFKEGED